MDDLFSFIPLIMGLFWFIFIISLVGKFAKAIKKAAEEGKGKGFDQQTVSTRLQELRKLLEEKAQQEAGYQGMPARSAMPSERLDSDANGKTMSQSQAGTVKVRRSRFEDYTAPAKAEYESYEGRAMRGELPENQIGSMEGTSNESLSESMDKDKYGSLTPFQQMLMSADMAHESAEGCASEESGNWKAEEMCEAWGEMTEGKEGEGLESDMLYLSSKSEASEVDLVGGINMKEMADAIIWAEILGKPICKRRQGAYGIGRHY